MLPNKCDIKFLISKILCHVIIMLRFRGKELNHVGRIKYRDYSELQINWWPLHIAHANTHTCVSNRERIHNFINAKCATLYESNVTHRSPPFKTC